MPPSQASLASKISFVLIRIIVPLWVLAGASFKLYELTPSNLPSVILKPAKNWQIDLDVLLRTLIGLEFFAVAVMVFIPRLSRAMAIFMLSGFCVILLGEMYRQATKCGCFGSITIKPWQMLLIDGTMLLAVLATWFLGRPKPAVDEASAGRTSLLKPALAMIPLLAAGLIVSFAVPEPPPKPQDVAPTPMAANDLNDNGESSPTPQPPADPQVNPNPQPLPNAWYTKSPGRQDDWIGKSWRDIDLFKFMPRWPKDLDTGKHYVVFYSRTCEHCEAMFRNHLIIPLDAPVAAVQIPASKTVQTSPGAWQMPPNPCELLDLPLGCNWIITPPLALTIVDGKVTCAVEGDGFEACLGLK